MGEPITKLFPSLDNDREVPLLDIVFPLCDQPSDLDIVSVDDLFMKMSFSEPEIYLSPVFETETNFPRVSLLVEPVEF